MARPLYEIAAEIRRDWKKVYFGAVPYLEALGDLDSIGDHYGADSGKSIVAYFLANAAGWRGETAKRVKKELNDMYKGKYASDDKTSRMGNPDDEDIGRTAEGCPDNLDEAECEEWEANTEKYKDKFKTAAGISVGHMKDGDQKTFSTEGVHAHVWFDLQDARNDFGGGATAGEWQVIVSTSPDPLNLKPRGRELARQVFRYVEKRAANLVASSAAEFIRQSLFKFRGKTAFDDGIMAEGCPDNLDESECEEWEANTEKYGDKVKTASSRRANHANLFDSIRAGDSVTFVDEGDGKIRKGIARIPSPGYWSLNMGGPHGTPAVISDETVIITVSRTVSSRRASAASPLEMDLRKLASERPELREHLVPLLKAAGTEKTAILGPDRSGRNWKWIHDPDPEGHLDRWAWSEHVGTPTLPGKGALAFHIRRELNPHKNPQYTVLYILRLGMILPDGSVWSYKRPFLDFGPSTRDGASIRPFEEAADWYEKVRREGASALAGNWEPARSGRSARTKKTAHGPIALKNPDVMLFMIDPERNNSKFYEMTVVVKNAETTALKIKNFTRLKTLPWVLMKRWGRLTDHGASGRVDSMNELYDTRREAEQAMYAWARTKTNKGYQDVSRTKKYPIGLGAAGFGWGGQAACEYVPELRGLNGQVGELLQTLMGMQRVVKTLDDQRSGMAVALKGHILSLTEAAGGLSEYLNDQLSHCR